VDAGAQMPVQTPLTHAELVQSVAGLQVPSDWQVCTPLPEHCVEFGVQVPEHAP
jgi:hypothetical protein